MATGPGLQQPHLRASIALLRLKPSVRLRMKQGWAPCRPVGAGRRWLILQCRLSRTASRAHDNRQRRVRLDHLNEVDARCISVGPQPWGERRGSLLSVHHSSLSLRRRPSPIELLRSGQKDSHAQNYSAERECDPRSTEAAANHILQFCSGSIDDFMELADRMVRAASVSAKKRPMRPSTTSCANGWFPSDPEHRTTTLAPSVRPSRSSSALQTYGTSRSVRASRSGPLGSRFPNSKMWPSSLLPYPLLFFHSALPWGHLAEGLTPASAVVSALVADATPLYGRPRRSSTTTRAGRAVESLASLASDASSARDTSRC